MKLIYNSEVHFKNKMNVFCASKDVVFPKVDLESGDLLKIL